VEVSVVVLGRRKRKERKENTLLLLLLLSPTTPSVGSVSNTHIALQMGCAAMTIMLAESVGIAVLQHGEKTMMTAAVKTWRWVGGDRTPKKPTHTTTKCCVLTEAIASQDTEQQNQSLVTA
jgi:hypothetical protein